MSTYFTANIGGAVSGKPEIGWCLHNSFATSDDAILQLNEWYSNSTDPVHYGYVDRIDVIDGKHIPTPVYDI